MTSIDSTKLAALMPTNRGSSAELRVGVQLSYTDDAVVHEEEEEEEELLSSRQPSPFVS